ncbi:MAG TPA: DUF2142 domain-containing protein, partial [Chloroflexota bacterium]|nr:DUF2142 domain-containing protein [Chloroflexota bacterium]
YTLVPYLPQTLVGIAARLFELRPLVVFYLGRLANLFAALTLVGLAMRVATELVAPIAAATLLPETLSEFASWSADPLTIALAFLLTAMLAAERITWATAVTAFFLGLCKPAYFLIALLVLLTRVRPRLKAAVVASSLLGTFLAWAYNSLGAYNQRIGVPVEARAQLACIVGEPLRFVRIFLHDVTEHGWTYLEQMTGRFGSVLQVQPSALLPWAELVLLLAVAMTGAPSLRAAFRVSAAVVIALTIGGILLATFLFSSIACGEAIEGVQGRYFLPLLPLALTLPAIARFKLALPVVVAGAVVCNVVALAAIARSFW